MTVVSTSSMLDLHDAEVGQVKAVNKFKSLTASKRPKAMHSILGDHEASQFSQPPTAIQQNVISLPHLEHKSHSADHFDRGHPEGGLVADGVHRAFESAALDGEGASPTSVHTHGQSQNTTRETSDPPPLSTESSADSDITTSRTATNIDDVLAPLPDKFLPFRSIRPHARTADDTGHKGQAHDPLKDHLYLFIGPSTFAAPSANPDRRASFVPDEDDVPIVSESPGAADVDIYETAYRDEIERILARAKEQEKEEPAVYLNRRIDTRLLAISGMAGRVAAAGEVGMLRLAEITQLRERAAKVTEVSRALREAAKEEYSRRKQERKEVYEAAKLKRSETKAAETAGNDASPETAGSKPTTAALTPVTPESSNLQKASSPTSQWTGKAAEKGKQASKSIMGFMDMVKTKSRTSRSKSDERT